MSRVGMLLYTEARIAFGDRPDVRLCTRERGDQPALDLFAFGELGSSARVTLTQVQLEDSHAPRHLAQLLAERLRYALERAEVFHVLRPLVEPETPRAFREREELEL